MKTVAKLPQKFPVFLTGNYFYQILYIYTHPIWYNFKIYLDEKTLSITTNR